MHVIVTTDPVIIDQLTVDIDLAPAVDWLDKGPWTVLAAISEGIPVAGALLVEPGKRGLPEVHIVVPKAHRGPTTVTAFELFRQWIVAHRPNLEGVWAYSDDPRTIRFARTMGFKVVDVDNDETWMFFELRKDSPCLGSQQ